MNKYDTERLALAMRLCDGCHDFYDLEKDEPYDKSDRTTNFYQNPRFIPMREWLYRQLGCTDVQARSLKIPLDYSTGTMVIYGFSFRVEPSRVLDVLGNRVRGNSSKHRVFIYCPVCGKYMPIGRIGQHAKVHRNDKG